MPNQIWVLSLGNSIVGCFYREEEAIAKFKACADEYFWSQHNARWVTQQYAVFSKGRDRFVLRVQVSTIR